jgi:hypothetical protein
VGLQSPRNLSGTQDAKLVDVAAALKLSDALKLANAKLADALKLADEKLADASRLAEAKLAEALELAEALRRSKG